MGISIDADTRSFLDMLKAKVDVKRGSYPNKLLISGMGGSGIGGRIMESLANFENIGDISSWNNYGLPAWLSSNDNVICVSYSGNTAETLSVAKDAHELGCEIEVITTGGKLGDLADKNRWQKTSIESEHQPRAALPLLLIPLLHKLKFPNIEKIVKEVSEQNYDKGQIDDIAKNLSGKIPCIYTDPSLEPVGYRWRCQIQENAKQLAFHHVLPEMNHNEIVGWTNSNTSMIPVLIRKVNEDNEIRNRFEALKNTAWKNVRIVEIFAKCDNHLSKMLETIYIGDMASIEIAKLNGVDPTPVEVIENLKSKLGGK
tara:strand:+ start:373 stop:1314 length:942 start_codon:yes stop_codon:yes gene_type:complete